MAGGKAAHTKDTHRVPSSGGQGRIPFRGTRNSSYTRPLLPDRGTYVAIWPITYRQTQRHWKNEETEEYIPNQTRPIPRKRDLNEKEINLPDKELKEMVRKMLTELGKAWMNTLVKTSTKKTEKYKKVKTEATELKNTTTELKNTLDGRMASQMK